MTCGEVRERLSEHALGLLDEAEAAAVDRHLEWCGGCRKEAGELQEALAAVAMSLPQSEPPASLEERIVAKVTTAAGRRPPVARSRSRVLVLVTLAAVVAAVTATGWAVAERHRAGDAEKRIELITTGMQNLQELVERSGGRQAALRPPRGDTGRSGLAILVHLESEPDVAFVEVLIPDPSRPPYTVRMLNATGETRLSVQLQPTNNGTLALLQRTDRDLRDVTRVQVLDRLGIEVLVGDVQLLASPAPR